MLLQQMEQLKEVEPTVSFALCAVASISLDS